MISTDRFTSLLFKVDVYFTYLQIIQGEVAEWQKKVRSVNGTVKHLVSEYGADDTSKITANMDQLNKRWTEITNTYVTNAI